MLALHSQVRYTLKVFELTPEFTFALLPTNPQPMAPVTITKGGLMHLCSGPCQQSGGKFLYARTTDPLAGIPLVILIILACLFLIAGFAFVWSVQREYTSRAHRRQRNFLASLAVRHEVQRTSVQETTRHVYMGDVQQVPFGSVERSEYVGRQLSMLSSKYIDVSRTTNGMHHVPAL